MTRKERLRRVVVLCSHFARNLAYYRSGWDGKQRLYPIGDFWTTMNGNCLDHCILEWCKLFADKKGRHHWRQIVSNVSTFEENLYRHLKLDADEFDKHIEKIRHLRDKFIAHLDSDLEMNIPILGVPKASVWFYHAHIVSVEAQPPDLIWLEQDLDCHYERCADEAKRIYGLNLSH